MSLLLNNSPLIGTLNLYDVVPVVVGVAADISHIETGVTVRGFAGDLKDKAKSKAALHEALEGVDVAVIPAGVPRKPGMTRDDLFAINAGIVSDLIEGIADVCPKCMICIISNPVNSTVPIAAEVLKRKGVYDPKRLFGVSALDIVRANTFLGEALNEDPANVNVPVIGGHSGVTILPLLSQMTPRPLLEAKKIEELTIRIQNAGTEVVEAKAGGGSATLSMAYAGAKFANQVLKGLSGEANVVACAYVESDIVAGLPFFASPIHLGVNGIEKVHSFGKLSEFEKKQLADNVIPNLKTAVDKGVAFVSKM